MCCIVFTERVKVRTLKEAENLALKQLVEAAWADAITHMKKRT
jgi:hypothetical protein